MYYKTRFCEDFVKLPHMTELEKRIFHIDIQRLPPQKQHHLALKGKNAFQFVYTTQWVTGTKPN